MVGTYYVDTINKILTFVFQMQWERCFGNQKGLPISAIPWSVLVENNCKKQDPCYKYSVWMELDSVEAYSWQGWIIEVNNWCKNDLLKPHFFNLFLCCLVSFPFALFCINLAVQIFNFSLVFILINIAGILTYNWQRLVVSVKNPFGNILISFVGICVPSTKWLGDPFVRSEVKNGL